MAAAEWVPILSSVVSGAAGISGALPGSRMTHKATMKREEEQYQRLRKEKRADMMRQLYLDMAQHVELTLLRQERLTDPLVTWNLEGLEYPQPAEAISPRVDLLCSPDLVAEWSTYTRQIG